MRAPCPTLLSAFTAAAPGTGNLALFSATAKADSGSRQAFAPRKYSGRKTWICFKIGRGLPANRAKPLPGNLSGA
jgi:hypothetical protein